MKQIFRYWMMDFMLTRLVDSQSYIMAGVRKKNEKADLQSIYVWNKTHERHDTLIDKSRFTKGSLIKIPLQLREHTVLSCSDGERMHVQLFKDTNQINYLIATYEKQGYVDVQVFGRISNFKVRRAYKEAIKNIVGDLSK